MYNLDHSTSNSYLIFVITTNERW